MPRLSLTEYFRIFRAGGPEAESFDTVRSVQPVEILADNSDLVPRGVGATFSWHPPIAITPTTPGHAAMCILWVRVPTILRMAWSHCGVNTGNAWMRIVPEEFYGSITWGAAPARVILSAEQGLDVMAHPNHHASPDEYPFRPKLDVPTFLGIRAGAYQNQIHYGEFFIEPRWQGATSGQNDLDGVPACGYLNVSPKNLVVLNFTQGLVGVTYRYVWTELQSPKQAS